MSDALEIRSIPGSSFQLTGDVNDVDSRSHEVLVKFPANTVDSYSTVFAPTAWKESFEKRLPVLCWQHRLDTPIGRATRAQVLPNHSEVVGRFSDLDAVPNARRAYSQIEDGTITDFSMGFKHAKYLDASKEFGKGVRSITSAQMIEFSPVSVGSIPGAEAVGLREEGGLVVPELSELIRMREQTLLTDEGFRALVGEHFPDLKEHIVVRSKTVVSPAAPAALVPETPVVVPDDTLQQIRDLLAGAGTRQVTDGNGATASASEDETEADSTNPRWTAFDSGSFTAEGPNGLTARVRPVGTEGKHSWSVLDTDDSKVDGGIEDDADTAKKKVHGVFGRRKNAKRAEEYLEDGYLTARSVLQLVRDTCPDMYAALSPMELEIRPAGTRADDPDLPDMDLVSNLAQTIDAALDSASQWLERADIGTLPDDVQQGLALVNGASASADALLDVLGLEDRDDTEFTRAATSFSDTPWGDIKQSDYDDDQWKNACVLDHGEDAGDTAKSRYGLPVKEPNGTYNRNGVHAAAQRFHQLKAPEAEKSKAAKKLVSLYHQMKEDPPDVLTDAAGDGTRATTSFSTKPWSDFNQSDYTPQQWKEACLIDTGEGDETSKDRYSLPVKEPNGTYNKNGIHAAASRLNQVEVGDAEKKEAAQSLARLYTQLGEDPPPDVEKLAGVGKRNDAAIREEALRRLDEITGRRK